MPRPTKNRRPLLQSLSRFVLLPENRSALRAIRRLAIQETKQSARRKPFPFLFLHGPTGSGKSHLVHGLMKRVIGRSPDRIARNIPARDLGPLLTQTSEIAGREFRDCDLLIVEDVHHLPLFAAEALASTIDHRQARDAATVFTADAGPASLTQLPARLCSRLAGGLVLGLEPLSVSSRLILARQFIQERGLHVAEELIDWLARLPAGGARSLVGDVTRLEHLSRLYPPPLSLAMATTELGTVGDEGASAIERIVERVAGRFGLKMRQMKSRDRHRNLLRPRQIGMYLARQLTDLSFGRIGAYFGGYDHSTVLHACRKVEEESMANVVFANDLKALGALVR